MSDPHQQITDLEAAIERLSERALQCRKIEVVAKAAAIGGSILFLAFMSGAAGSDPLWFVTAVGATLGGVVLFGSNRSTLDEITATMAEYEAERRELIDGLEPRTVQEIHGSERSLIGERKT
jgi:hypothetical protein